MNSRLVSHFASLGLGALALSGTFLAGCGDDEPTTCDPSCGTTTATTTTSTQGSGGSGGAGGGATTSQGVGGAGGQGGAGGSGGAGGAGGSGGAGGGPPDAWVVPACAQITGTDAVTFTLDEGATLTPTQGTLHGVGYTFGLAALDTPNTLLAEHKGDLLRSEDAGCTWAKIGDLSGGLFHITAGKGGVAYAWVDNGAAFYRIEGGVATPLSTPLSSIVGVGVDPENGLHLRIGDASGAQSDSVDGGDNWAKQGTPAGLGDPILGYRFAYDPANLDHVLFGQSSAGSRVSIDGGANWATSTGLGGVGANAFSIAVSPVDGQIVWLEGIEIGPDVRHVYRSGDGGATFDIVVTENPPDVDLINGTLLVPDAANADRLYFVFGTYFADYGTDIYRYDHALGTVEKEHNDYDDVSSIVASPADPSVLYFGLTVEEIWRCTATT